MTFSLHMFNIRGDEWIQFILGLLGEGSGHITVKVSLKKGRYRIMYIFHAISVGR